jgi:anti-sigma regulatory factor (Ser/Thr protein kinase)
LKRVAVTVEQAPLVLELPSDPESATSARHAACRYAERVGADPEAVGIAVAEAVANAIVHGYRDGRRGTIVVRVRSDQGALHVSVADSGNGMAPHPMADGLGLGLSLIGHVSDRFEIQSFDEGGTLLMMRFGLSGEAA